MEITPLKADGPYKAPTAPEIMSTCCTSSSEAPKKFPKEKFKPGA